MSRKSTIIPIKSFREAKPKEGVWYSYGDEIYHSVICAPGRTSHIRCQSARESIGGDNIMSAWHRDWQYNQIEHYYGLFERGLKTYEIGINHDYERHIIDSVVDSIALEFQHTLSVGVYELDKRFIAQKAHGYIPYLVLDFTLYSFPQELSYVMDFDAKKLREMIIDYNRRGKDCEVMQKMFKWTSSLHFKEGNVFFEFADCIIRFHTDLLRSIKLSKQIFIETLLDLEAQLKSRIQLDIKIRERLELKALERSKEMERREAEERFIQNQKKIKEEEEARLSYFAINKRQRCEGEQYQRFRDILKIPLVNKYLEKYNFDNMLFDVEIKSRNDDNLYVKNYVYLCEEEGIMLHYRTNGERNPKTNKYTFSSSEIKIHRRENYEVRTFTFLQKGRGLWQKVDAKSELAINFLHSFKFPALIKYDDFGRIVLKEWYLFNNRVDEDIFKLAGDCYDMYNVLEDNESRLTADQYMRLQIFSNKVDQADDPYRFIEFTMSYHGITDENFEEYYEDRWIEFETNLQKRYFVKSL